MVRRRRKSFELYATFRKVMTKVGLADAAKRYMRATDTEWPSFLPISLVLSPFWSNLDENGNHPLKSSQFQDFLDIHRQCLEDLRSI